MSPPIPHAWSARWDRRPCATTPRVLEDLHAKLLGHDDWLPLGSADEQKTPNEGTVEAWARAQSNPIGGWYGLKKGYRGRVAMYVPPLMEALGLAEVEHNAGNNRMRAI